MLIISAVAGFLVGSFVMLLSPKPSADFAEREYRRRPLRIPNSRPISLNLILVHY